LPALKSNKSAETEISVRRDESARIYFLQHLAQPAASVQHFAQVAGSLQQSPVQALAAGLQQELLLLLEQQPVVIRTAAAQATARSMIVFIFLLCGG
jgi:hypothetical protein